MHSQVSGMSLGNFWVRSYRRSFERNSDASVWLHLTGAAARLKLITDVGMDGWWDVVTVEMLQMLQMLQMIRIQLRVLVHLIDSAHKLIVATNFAEVEDISFVHVVPTVNTARFRGKALAFLRSHQNDVVLAKICLGNQLVFLDLLVDQLTERGVVEPDLGYEAPVTAVALVGPTCGARSQTSAVSNLLTFQGCRLTAADKESPYILYRAPRNE